MTQRLYFNDPSLLEFTATVSAVQPIESKTMVSLDRSAFYPNSGGQNSDIGTLGLSAGTESVSVIEVREDEQTGEVWHLIAGPADWLQVGASVRGQIDPQRRRDHRQQHSGQHVLSAAFEKLFGFPTVSFHMGEETCTIDLAAEKVSAAQLESAERLANEVIFEDRRVEIRYATPDEARNMGVRKIPPAVRDTLRLIDIRDFDLNACGGTHVHSTGQIGSVLLRKTEKVKQGVRVEFVCGLRAVAIARLDFRSLTEAASVYSAQLPDVPVQARKALDDVKAGLKAQHRLLEEVAELQAANLLRSAHESPAGSRQKLVAEFFAERNLDFIKMLAQRLIRQDRVAVFVGCGGAQPSLVFAQTPGLSNDMGGLMKETMQKLGTRGGGNRDMAQGGAPDAASAERAVHEAAGRIG